MSDQQLQQSAGQIADAQTTGPLDQLARQIARNNQQTSQAQGLTAGYYNQLGGQVQQGNQQLAGISSGLNDQLAKIGTDTQSTLTQAYKPSEALSSLQEKGLGGGGFEALQAELARQQGYAAQNAGTFRSFGAQQGANAQTLGAQNLGTFGLKGQESLGAIGRAGQLRNAPLSDKQAGLIANRRNLYATALGRLQQGERNYGLARASLGLKEYTAQTGRETANTNRQKAITQAQYDQARISLGQLNAQLRQQGLSETQRHNLVSEQLRNKSIVDRYNQQKARGNPATYGQKSGAKSLITNVNSLVGQFQKNPDSHAVTQQAQSSGFTRAEINIARDIAKLGRLSPQNLQTALQMVGGNKSLLPPGWGVG